MKVEIRYGAESLPLNLPEDAIVDEYQYRADTAAVDRSRFEEILNKAEAGLFKAASADLIIVNDAYRSTPTAMILGWLKEAGRFPKKFKILIATGCHQRPTEPQLREIFGPLHDELIKKVHIHDARKLDEMEPVGQESTGEPVYLNRLFVKARRPIVIGSVEPHYFAGFTGGRKSIFPGICDYDTTVRNHNRAVDFAAAPMKLDGNPVAEHLQYLMQFARHKKILGIQVITDNQSHIRGLYAGELEATFHEAIDSASGMFGFRARQTYDIIIAEVRPPLDANLYQLQKAAENCRMAVAKGGTILLFSPCLEGIGSKSFYELAERWNPDSPEIPTGADSFGIHKLARINKIVKSVHLLLYSSLKAGISDKVFFKSIADPQKTLDKLIAAKENPAIALVRDASNTVLVSD
jgi:nickel-dependent lactate racemase